MSDNISLKRASSYYFFGNIFNKGIAFLTVPIFTRLLNTAEYGIVTTFNSWATIASMVFGFTIYMGIRAAFIDYDYAINDVLSVTSTFTWVSGGIISIGIIFFNYLKLNIDFVLVLTCCIQGISLALIQNYMMYLMMKYEYKSRTALMIFPNLVSAIISIIVVTFFIKDNLYYGRIIPSTIITATFGFYALYKTYKKSLMLFNRGYLIYTLRISSPLVLHGIALNILAQSDLTMITWLSDSSETGIYSLIYNFGMIATVMTTSLEGIWVPWFTNRLGVGSRNEINYRSMHYIRFMTIIMIGIILAGPEIVKFLASEKYWRGIIIIPPIVIANYLIFAYTLFVNIEHFYKKTIFITVNTLIAALSNLILNYLLIPHYGYIAAAYTTVGSYFLAFVMHAFYSKKLEPDLYPLPRFIPSLIQMLIASFVFYFFIECWSVRWGIAIAWLLIYIFVNRDMISDYIPNKIKFKKR